MGIRCRTVGSRQFLLCGRGLFLLLAVLVVTGCSETPGPAESESSEGRASAGSLPAGKAAAKPVDIAITPPAGRWLMIWTNGNMDEVAALLLVSQSSDGAWKLDVLDVPAGSEPIRTTAFEVDAEKVHWHGVRGEDDIDFRGEVRGRLLQGNVYGFEGACLAARWEPTAATTLGDSLAHRETPGLATFRAQIEKASRDEFLPLAVAFCRANPDSPMSLHIAEQIVAGGARGAFSPAEAKQAADIYLELSRRWGRRRELSARLDVALTLAVSGVDPAQALAHLEFLESSWDDDLAADWRPFVRYARYKAHGAQARSQALAALSELTEASPPKRKQLAEQLTALHEAHPFVPEATYGLARALQASEPARAIELYAELSVLPMAEQLLLSRIPDIELSPTEQLAILWRQEKGSTEGLQEYREKVYAERIRGLATRRPAETTRVSPAGRRILCELFTGSQCPPCVAADVALEALSHTLDQDRLIVLRYHQHIPGPDPLCNSDSESRFETYRGENRSTPALYIDGREVPFGVGGMLEDAPRVYEELVSLLEPLQTRTTPYRLHIQAVERDGVFQIACRVEGLVTVPDSYRLHLAVAESDIRYIAANGVRRHEMVVRALLTGAGGIAPEQGRLQWQKSLSVDQLRQRLKRYLDAYEADQGYRFPARPLKLENLKLVAFVQDQRTGEVMQAAVAALGNASGEAPP